MAASSRWVGKPDRRARTVTTTKLMLNMMWAIRIVTALSGKNGGARDRHEQGQQRRPEHDLGRGHRQEDEQVGAASTAEVVPRQGQRDERPEDGRDDRRQQRDDEADGDRALESGHPEDVQPGVDREALPHEVALAGGVVEAEQRP